MTEIVQIDFNLTVPPAVGIVRDEIRAFLKAEAASGSFEAQADAWLSGHSPEFTKKLAAHGWLGMTWPAEYGGHERSSLERYAVIEELLAAGAPVAAHWIADRQTGPLLLRYGTENQRKRFMPLIADGECFFALGMSEPDSGSDLASVRTKGQRTDGGWILSGTKVWTSHAHRSHFIVVLARTEPLDVNDRHRGLTQFIVDLSDSGVEVNPIALLNGEHHFNEVVLNDVFVPADMVIGSPGLGWEQVTSELAYERSGPERFLSTFPLFTALVAELSQPTSTESLTMVGEIWAELWSLRKMSMAIAAALDDGSSLDMAAAAVKDLGTRFESKVIDVARRVITTVGPEQADSYRTLLSESVLSAPGFTLRGGTNEILRGIVARQLGLR